MKKLFTLFALILMLTVTFASCGGEDNPADDETDGQNGENTENSGNGKNDDENEEFTYSQGLEFAMKGYDTCYVSGIGTCTDKDIVIPPITHKGDRVVAIDDNAFEGCDSITSVVIPEGVTEIGKLAFYQCTSLKSITIPDSITSVGRDAFHICYKLVEVINKSSLNIVAGSSGYGYVASYAIEVHSGESKIVNKDNYLFYTYNGVNYLFGYVGNDTKLTLPESYNGESYEIYNYAFYDCYSLTSVTIPNSITSIGNGAFGICDLLTSVTIPDSVTSIGDWAFYACDSLTDVYYTGSEEEWAKISMGSYNDYLTNATIHYNYEEN